MDTSRIITFTPVKLASLSRLSSVFTINVFFSVCTSAIVVRKIRRKCPRTVVKMSNMLKSITERNC